jgi:hypothetical protein
LPKQQQAIELHAYGKRHSNNVLTTEICYEIQTFEIHSSEKQLTYLSSGLIGHGVVRIRRPMMFKPITNVSKQSKYLHLHYRHPRDATPNGLHPRRTSRIPPLPSLVFTNAALTQILHQVGLSCIQTQKNDMANKSSQWFQQYYILKKATKKSESLQKQQKFKNHKNILQLLLQENKPHNRPMFSS